MTVAVCNLPEPFTSAPDLLIVAVVCEVPSEHKDVSGGQWHGQWGAHRQAKMLDVTVQGMRVTKMEDPDHDASPRESKP